MATAQFAPGVGMNPLWLAQSRLRRRRFDDAVEICTDLLHKNALDQQAWFVKVRATTLKNWVDDTELEEEGAGDLILEDNAVQAAARPGTSLSRPLMPSGTAAGLRPLTQSGRPTTGFARPGTSSRPMTGAARQGTAQRMGTAQQRVTTALRGGKPGTARPTTTSGRFVRLGTASLASQPGGPFIDVTRLDVTKYASRKHLARALCDYVLYGDRNDKVASVLCQAVVAHTGGEDWWWQARAGMCYYRLGLFQEAIRRHERGLELARMDETVLHLTKCYMRIDQPLIAAKTLRDLAAQSPEHCLLLLGEARVHDALNDGEASLALYKRVLHLDAGNVEAMACMAAHHFYSDQPEVALRFYRRLLMMGAANAELWNNLGLCCFYASQYDMIFRCFENALLVADDMAQADVWYNLSHVAVGLGDKNLAYQALKVAVSLNGNHAEALNNLGVLELLRGNPEGALASYAAAQELAPAMFEPLYNGALSAYKGGELEKAHGQVQAALAAYPEHASSQELLKQICDLFSLK